MWIPNLGRKISTLTLFSLRVLLEVSHNRHARLLTCLSLVWKWPSAVYSCITFSTSGFYSYCPVPDVEQWEALIRGVIFKQKPDMGNYPEAELRSIIFSTIIYFSFHSLLIIRRKIYWLFSFHLCLLPLTLLKNVYFTINLLPESRSWSWQN